MNATLQQLMRTATDLTRTGQLNEATEAIQRALRGAAQSPMSSWAGSRIPMDENVTAKAAPTVLDGCVFEVDARTRPAAESGPGVFTSGTHTHASLTRRFKLYTPPGNAGQELPLVVMLHGCTQNPDDFAAGTAMNLRAREQNFMVLYPEQSYDANPTRCWNWFQHNHQQRDIGEPGLLASLTKAVIQAHALDERRVFVAGLSAGGAMAAIVASAYPEIFAAVGVHSGLPCGAASNVSEALMVMQNGKAGSGLPGQGGRFGSASSERRSGQSTVPTIVFHGDQDQTVHPRNGEQVIAAVLGATVGNAQVEQGMSAQGRRYTRSRRRGDNGRALTEHWLVHGAGHAWSGGLPEGSYTDKTGPDATLAMLSFFFGQVD